MPPKDIPTIAQGDEILQYLTTILRAEGQGAGQRLKAAELLGKRLGLFDAARAEGAPPVQIISDIPPPAQQAAPAGDAGGGSGHADE